MRRFRFFVGVGLLLFGNGRLDEDEKTLSVLGIVAPARDRDLTQGL